MTVSNIHASAGVFTNEKDLSERIAAASTSVVAIVGASPKGPVGIPTLVTDKAEYKEIFGANDVKKHGFISQSMTPILQNTRRAYVVRVTNGALYGGAYLTVDDPNAPDPNLALTNFDDGTNQPKGRLDPLSEIQFLPDTPGASLILGAFYAIDPGEWNKQISVKVTPANPKGVPVRGASHDPKKFYVEVYLNYTGGIFEQPVERWLCTRHDEVDENNNQLFIEDVINHPQKGSRYIRFINNSWCDDLDIVKDAFETFDGSSDGILPTNDQVINAWDAFLDTDNIDVNILVNNGFSHHTVQHKIHEVAKSRGDSLAVLDMPSSHQTAAAAVNYKTNILNIDSSWAAIYSSDVLITDEDSGKRMFVPPSGYVAGAMAYTDNNGGVWRAPAGIELATLDIEGVREHYNQGHRDALSLAQVNPIRKLPRGLGYALWDQQTTQRKSSAFQWVQVRRLTNFVLTSTSLSAKFSLFDPNDQFLRSGLRSKVESFLEPIRIGRGLDEYLVICDDTNNKAETIANGDLILDMYIDPTIAAKRVHVIFNINKTGSSATD